MALRRMRDLVEVGCVVLMVLFFTTEPCIGSLNFCCW